MVLSFAQRLSQGPIQADGAMGTELLLRGNLSIDACRSHLNTTYPNLLRRIYLHYIEASAELIETNTYGEQTGSHWSSTASPALSKRSTSKPLRLPRGGAQRLTGQRVWIAAVVGLLGKGLAPLGPISHALAQEVLARGDPRDGRGQGRSH